MPPEKTYSRRSVIAAGGLSALGSVTNASAANAEATSIRIGLWTPAMAVHATAAAALDDTESMLGRTISIASTYRGGGDFDPALSWTWPYSTDYATGVDAGRILLVAWSLEDIADYAWWASGAGDDILRAHARSFRAYGGTIVVRPWAEMNADFQFWQVTVEGTKGGSPASFIAAWRRMVDIIRPIAPDVKYCFCPTTDVYAETTDVSAFFPGVDYVDVLGLDGYNWGTSISGGVEFAWTGFSDVYAAQYSRLVSLAPGKPVWICEVSSADPLATGVSGVEVAAPTGSSKGSWWQAMVEALNGPTFPAVQAVAFFDEDKERHWGLSSSSESRRGLTSALSEMPERRLTI